MTIKYNINSENSDEVNEPEGVYQAQQPLTFEKVWQLFQETKQFLKEQALYADKRFKKTERVLKKQSLDADKRFKETEQILKKRSLDADKRFKETERILRNATRMAGGLGNNIGEVAEEYFRSAFEKTDELAGIKIEQVSTLKRKTKKLQGEYDVVLYGNETLIVVEVKHKLESKDVITYCDHSLPIFRQLFAEYSGYKVIGAVAGMTATKSAIKTAYDRGLLVFTQSGQKIQLHNPAGFKPKAF